MINAGTIHTAANIRTGSGTLITLEDFLEVYPQFKPESSTVPEAYLSMILDTANRSISENRWHSQRKMAVCLYVAHFATLWLKTSAGMEGANPAIIANKGNSNSNISSKSVGGVSVSYGAAEGSSDLGGYGSWKETLFGQQLATMAKLVGAGMMVVR